jgi:acetyl esterase/lipase
MTTSSVHPPFDEELLPFLAKRRAAAVPYEDLSLARAASVQRAVSVEDLAEEFEVTFRGAVTDDQTEVPLLVLRPRGVTHDLPVVYYIHGGGMITGNNRLGLDRIVPWQAITPMAIVSVDYRLAPEHRHPVPFGDCWTGLVWTTEHAAELGLDTNKVLVTGISAGGGLAAALALRARDSGQSRLCGQLLICPMLDDRAATPSSRELNGEGVWDSAANEFGWHALLGDAAAGPDVPQEAAPARAKDLGGLPPTFLDVGSAETFRDEIVDYAARIWRAGGDAELHVWPGAYHGFDASAPEATLSKRAREARVEWLRRILA